MDAAASLTPNRASHVRRRHEEDADDMPKSSAAQRWVPRELQGRSEARVLALRTPRLPAVRNRGQRLSAGLTVADKRMERGSEWRVGGESVFAGIFEREMMGGGGHATLNADLRSTAGARTAASEAAVGQEADAEGQAAAALAAA